MNRQRNLAAVGLVLLMLAGCTAGKGASLDPANPTNGVYVTRMALTQTYNALTVGLLTGTVTKAQAQDMAPKLQQAEAALSVAEVAADAATSGNYLVAARLALDAVRSQLNLPPVGG